MTFYKFGFSGTVSDKGFSPESMRFASTFSFMAPAMQSSAYSHSSLSILSALSLELSIILGLVVVAGLSILSLVSFLFIIILA